MTPRTFPFSQVRKADRPLPDHEEDSAWINEHMDELRSSWVVVRHGQLVGANPNIRELMDKLSQDAHPDAMVTYVPTEEEAQRVVFCQPNGFFDHFLVAIDDPAEMIYLEPRFS